MVSDKPFLPKVTITSGGTTRTFNPIDLVFDFNLLTLDVDLNADNNKNTTTITIEDSDATFLDTFDAGNEVIVFIGKTSADLANNANRIFRGFIEDKGFRFGMNSLVYELTCPSISSRFDLRIVDVRKFQKRAANGIDLDPTDATTELSQIVKDIVQSTDSYPAKNGPSKNTIATDDGITVTNVASSGIKIPDYILNLRPASDGFNELAESAGGFIWFVDPAKDLHWKKPATTSTGILLTNTLSPTWDTTKFGYIQSINGVDTIEATRNSLFGVGGDDRQKSLSQETDNASKTLEAEYASQQITPVNTSLLFLQLKVRKIGSPARLTGDIVEDNAGNPTGSVVKIFDKDASRVSTTADYIVFDIGEDNINTKQIYHIRLFKVGDATNTYAWHFNNTAGTGRKKSTDGITWTADTTGEYDFRIESRIRLFTNVFDESSITKYDLREGVINRPEIKTAPDLEKLLDGLIDFTAKKRRILDLAVYPPDNLLSIGQTAKIQYTHKGTFRVDGDFEISGIRYTFDQGKSEKNWSFGVKAVEFRS